MQAINTAWCIQIDITNFCKRSCLYCSRYNRHLRKDQRKHMSLEQISNALDTLKTWPKKIGIIGGEPILHPDFEDICKMIRFKFPKQKMMLWTAGGKNFKDLNPIIKNTFGSLAYNEHNQEQINRCKHQPITVAIIDVIKNKKMRDVLIDDCWVQRTWCPTINHFGAYFCEVAAAQDVLLNDGRNAWPVVARWWDKGPEKFKDKVAIFCDNCGMAIPMERELITKRTEKFSPALLQTFRDNNLAKVDDIDIELFDYEFSENEIISNVNNWTPGNYRGDLAKDEVAPEGKGFTKSINLLMESF